jgi:hypothetical protein
MISSNPNYLPNIRHPNIIKMDLELNSQHMNFGDCGQSNIAPWQRFNKPHLLPTIYNSIRLREVLLKYLVTQDPNLAPENLGSRRKITSFCSEAAMCPLGRVESS